MKIKVKNLYNILDSNHQDYILLSNKSTCILLEHSFLVLCSYKSFHALIFFIYSLKIL